MAATLQGNDIESARVPGPSCFLLQKMFGGQRQFFLLAGIDTAECAAEACVQPVTNFDEYYCIAVEHDQIKLAAFASPVLRQQLQALRLKVMQGLLFGRDTRGLARTVGHQRGVSGRRLT